MDIGVRDRQSERYGPLLWRHSRHRVTFIISNIMRCVHEFSCFNG
jgi:hypothetical protein